jgi:FtsP/CotA-like multicopper oxidase with cupredoxin domain
LLTQQDVLHIGANVGKITLAARYGPHLGEYMMHCHNGVHEDNDMFRAFMVRLYIHQLWLDGGATCVK